MDTRRYPDELMNSLRCEEAAKRLNLSKGCQHKAGKKQEGNNLRCVTCKQIVGFVKVPTS